MQVPEPFDLALVCRSHGWYDLAPWRWDETRRLLARPLRLGPGRVVGAEVAEGQAGLLVRLAAAGRVTRAEAEAARGQLARALALDEELAPFRELAAGLEARRAAGQGRHLPDLRWALRRGAGRLLRSPTVFEDAVKTLCTTNCSWSLTRLMVSRLCEALGEPGPDGTRAFPTPEAMARRPEAFFRERIRAGYRSRALRALARSVADGSLDLEALRSPHLATEELLERLEELDGFGPYAAQHLARLLGRHDFLALDSWTRGKLKALRAKRRVPADATVRGWYRPYGRWAGLAMWLEVTADWFEPAPPAPG